MELCSSFCVRYAQGSKLTDPGGAARERFRLEAVARFESGETTMAIAATLRVSKRSVEQWRRAWWEHGRAVVLSKGFSGLPRPSQEQIARLGREFERGPLVHGWEDQRWTLASIKTLIGQLFRIGYTVEGTWRLLKRGVVEADPARERARRSAGRRALYLCGCGVRSGGSGSPVAPETAARQHGNSGRSHLPSVLSQRFVGSKRRLCRGSRRLSWSR
ncbi:helix-turn-helix domain-containing protein [Streptomyces sp. G-5]|uniref:helix-turn-helix domain-containing protein n=1 Tax=Streptomyces sp. G-5 TaxID=2977231 RepID=UPI0021CFCC72|nr:helix-turn-helix domain-containing protein [Streptomyces sp. G-5]MCU4750054.1 winged helix-turn-helix domain-containing protein [Streptomyces sp. G-5]